MDFDYILEKLSKVRELPENVDELFEQLQIEDIFTMFFASFTVETKSPEDLETLRIDLEDNVRQNKNHETDPFISNVWEVAAEESIAKKFDVNLIRNAISLGLYPMSAKIDSLFFPTFKYHLSKCIITFDKLHISRNVKKYITKYFSDYTIAFNRDFSQTISKLQAAYEDTWLCDDLCRVFEEINSRPNETTAVDSVEIWHNGKIVAGEIGFRTGTAYASLSGFHTEDNIGHVQMAVLGLWLRENGFAFWDLGMSLPYKYRYGAADYDRDEQEKMMDKINGTKIISFPSEEIPLTYFLKYL
ncbi:MAG: hypothetical protein UIT85_02640 [Treponema sp.]|nr:hypothetical protein [Treponema sp.]